MGVFLFAFTQLSPKERYIIMSAVLYARQHVVLSALLAVVILPVCPSVCLSVTTRYQTKPK